MVDYLNQRIIESLKNNGIDIHDSNYKNSEKYAEIRYNHILGIDGIMTVEEYIERYLLTAYEVAGSYSNIYDMGNTEEMYFEDCEYVKLAEEINQTLKLNKDPEDVAERFYRKGGLIDRLKKHLNFDVELFDKNNEKYQCELYKIFYFFYMLENWKYKEDEEDGKSENVPIINILVLLSKPSMENIDNFPLGLETSNGIYIMMVKDSLEKELSENFKNNAQNAIYYIVSGWDRLLENINFQADHIESVGDEPDFENMINSDLLQSAPEELFMLEKVKEYNHSPIETLYLKIIQYEYLGNIKDILMINNILTETDYSVPLEFVDDMKIFATKKVHIENVEKYIEEKALDIAKYVYLKSETDKEDRRRIRNSKEKVSRLINFCVRARPLLNMSNVLTELLIISCLQAIILDESNEIFDYTFYGYERESKRKPQVQAALKSNKRTYDALQVYWVRKVTDRWYANIGRYNSRVELRKFENKCDETLIKILSCPTITEMLRANSFYYNRITY